KRDWQRGRSDAGDSRGVLTVWKGVIEGTTYAGQARVTASESYRSLAAEAAKTARLSKERMLKKSIEQLQKAQAELLETVKELDKAKKQFTHLQHSSPQARGPCGALAGVQNEYVLTLVSANAHLDHYYRVELPAVMQALDGDLYERLRDHLTTAGQAEVETCRATQEWFQSVSEAATRVCREQDLLLFLQDHAAFTHPVLAQVSLLEPEDGGASLEKEARRWATRVTRDGKNKAHGEEVLQRLEARRQQVSEAEAAAVERQMEEVRENIRKAEVGKAKAEARLALLRAVGLDVDAWLAGAVRAGEEHPRTPSSTRPGEEEPAGLDPAEFNDYDSDETFEDAEPGHTARTYPYTCRVIFGYQGRQADELSIAQGEELEVIEDGDMEEWVKARNKAGQIGYVPEKYLLSLGCVGSEPSLATGTGVVGPSGAALQRQLSTWLVRALYDYEGQSPEELSFPEGAIIRVLPRAEDEVDDGFWTGDFDGRVGVFPSLVVEELTGARGMAGQVGDSDRGCRGVPVLGPGPAAPRSRAPSPVWGQGPRASRRLLWPGVERSCGEREVGWGWPMATAVASQVPPAGRWALCMARPLSAAVTPCPPQDLDAGLGMSTHITRWLLGPVPWCWAPAGGGEMQVSGSALEEPGWGLRQPHQGPTGRRP
uniref:FCH and double SH3 domains 1 n=1 Tax=Anser cygnoides TaxID=8845 RepID=A0A8B9DKY7_ANSCY